MKMKSQMNRWALLLLALVLTACQSPSIAPAAPPAKSPGQLLFEEKCQTVAGEKIYRKVEDVEGIVLLKVRPARGERELADRMWPGAAFATEFRADEYIKSFFWYEHLPEIPSIQTRGILNTEPSNLPGYRYVDVIDEKDGKRYRYTGRWEEPWQYDKSYLKGYIKFFLDKTPTTSPAPRYGVTYEDHVAPEERELGVASSTVKVIDLQTQEVLGEMTRYAWGAVKPSYSNPSPWLTANQCPRVTWRFAQTRQFVDQILIPRKDK
ncbi:MAG TPA: hypothetical protein VFW68_01740 [Rhodocyclaceae bacterium]|nr:hypothetical protein [Rhodocyclaceae bacterium]